MSLFPRSSGVLMPIPMLNGPFGIGVLGNEAKDFIDFLRQSGFRAWQVLPVECVGAGFSPYSCLSAHAGEPMLIDPRGLLDMGLVTQDELARRAADMNPHSVDYVAVRDRQMELLRIAFSRLESDEYRSYNPFWLDDYALYMAVRQTFDQKPWYSWPDEKLKMRDDTALAAARKRLSSEIDFMRFVQWLFNKQWSEIRGYAEKNGVTIIGDLPFYLPGDSAEVWSNPEMFEMCEDEGDGCFKAVSGVPPDYFSPDGQNWGNPIYNWKYIKQNGYVWWIDRVREALERYGMLRIDHFRGFASYWSIPAGCSAKDGEWIKGPGYPLFKALEGALGKLPVIAEDLGIIDEPVEKLLERTGFRGLRVLQFGFLGDEKQRPHRLPENCVAYTGTHDNTTLLAWLYELRPHERDLALFYLGFEGDWTQGGAKCTVNKAWIRQLLISAASLVIIPIQDLLGYGADTRTNIPGTPDGNWRFRIGPDALATIDRGYYKELSRLFDRDNLCMQPTASE